MHLVLHVFSAVTKEHAMMFFTRILDDFLIFWFCVVQLGSSFTVIWHMGIHMTRHVLLGAVLKWQVSYR